MSGVSKGLNYAYKIIILLKNEKLLFSAHFSAFEVPDIIGERNQEVLRKHVYLPVFNVIFLEFMYPA